MPSAEVQIGVAALLEQCAHQRAGAVPTPYQDDSTRVIRMLQAEAAGRELMAALVRPDPYPDISLGAVLRRLIGYLQTVIIASIRDEQVTPLLTVRVHHVTVEPDVALLLRDAAILLVLSAYDDGAANIDVRLDDTGAGVRLTVESDRPGIAASLPTLHTLQSSIAARNGLWEVVSAAHGASWLAHIVLPAPLVRETSKQELVHDN